MTDETQTTTPVDASEFSLRKAHELVRDLMTPNPWIYWADFLFNISLGWAAFFIALNAALFSPVQIIAYIIAVLTLYRAAIFVHELAHLKQGTFRTFRFVWNTICGIPLMIPSFTYDGVHNDHHKPDVYGTKNDGEYIPFATQRPIEMVGYVLLSFLLPALLIIRFLILTPLAYLSPAMRKIVWERASSLTIDPSYTRAANAIRNDHNWHKQEFAAFLFAATIILCITLNILPYSVLILWYAIAVVIFLLNSLRTLAAHAYRNPGIEKLTFAEQYLDSINVPGNPLLTPLWAPVGLRYHATHHLFMMMPYHNLGVAQRRLINSIHNQAQHQQTVRSSLWNALTRIWNESSVSQQH